MGPIGSAVLTFIGYKQTDKQYLNPLRDREFVGNLILRLHFTNNFQTNKTNPEDLKTYFEKQIFVFVLFQNKIIKIKLFYKKFQHDLICTENDLKLR